MPTPVCQYCGCGLSGQAVRCPRCKTPHCRDCWRSNGGRCTTYGCAPDSPAAWSPEWGTKPNRTRPLPQTEPAARGTAVGRYGRLAAFLLSIVVVPFWCSSALTSGRPGSTSSSRVNYGPTWSGPVRAGKAWQAFRVAQVALVQNPGDPQRWIARGDAHVGLALEDEHGCTLLRDAIDDYGRAIRLSSRDPGALAGRGIARAKQALCVKPHEEHRQTRIAAAIEDLDRAIQGGGATAEAYAHRGLIRHAQQDWTGAWEDFEQAGRMTPPASTHFLREKAEAMDVLGRKAPAERSDD